MQIIEVIKYTNKDRDDFVDGWKAVAGYIDDIESGIPYCFPWRFTDAISIPKNVEEPTPYEAGKAYWYEMKAEIVEKLKHEIDELKDERCMIDGMINHLLESLHKIKS